MKLRIVAHTPVGVFRGIVQQFDAAQEAALDELLATIDRVARLNIVTDTGYIVLPGTLIERSAIEVQRIENDNK